MVFLRCGLSCGLPAGLCKQRSCHRDDKFYHQAVSSLQSSLMQKHQALSSMNNWLIKICSYNMALTILFRTTSMTNQSMKCCLTRAKSLILTTTTNLLGITTWNRSYGLLLAFRFEVWSSHNSSWITTFQLRVEMVKCHGLSACASFCFLSEWTPCHIVCKCKVFLQYGFLCAFPKQFYFD